MARLRLQAGCCMLKLAQEPVYAEAIRLEQFETMALLVNVSTNCHCIWLLFSQNFSLLFSSLTDAKTLWLPIPSSKLCHPWQNLPQHLSASSSLLFLWQPDSHLRFLSLDRPEQRGGAAGMALWFWGGLLFVTERESKRKEDLAQRFNQLRYRHITNE